MVSQIITVTQQKGGSGKTTLTTNIAIGLLLSGRGPVGVLDIDPQGSLGEWFEKREAALGEEETGLTFRTASGWGARREARNLARDCAYVVIDTPPKSESDVRSAIEIADQLLIPIQPSPVDLWATHATLDLAAKEKKEARLVLNRVPPRSSLTQEMLNAMADFPNAVAATRLGNRTAFAGAMGEGSTVIEKEPRSKAAEEVNALVAELFSLA